VLDRLEGKAIFVSSVADTVRAGVVSAYTKIAGPTPSQLALMKAKAEAFGAAA